MINDEMNRNEITLYAVNRLGLKAKARVYKTTREMAFHCPFHVDKTPSMFINFDMGVYNCFSCGKSGSIESLYYELTGSNLRKELGLVKDSFSSFAYKSSFNYKYSNEEDLNLKKVYVNLDRTLLQDAWDVEASREYLIERGIDKNTSKKFKFQYAEDIDINTTRFHRRLIIPIYENHRLIAVEGRRVFPEDPDPKVLYAKNCSVNSLFDIDNLDKHKPVYAVEGLMDLAVLRTCEFFKNSTSIFGASLTKRQLHLIESFDDFIYIPDSDAAGEKTVAKLKASGLQNISILKLPKTINNIPIKDVGDIPKTKSTVQDIVDRKWLSYIRKI